MRRTAAVAAFTALGALAAACGSSSSGSSAPPSSTTSSTPAAATSSAASSDNAPIKIGVITSLTGAAASGFGGGVSQGVKAAIGAANAAGGVNGHKITFEVLDDQSTPAGAAAATKKAIQQDHDFAILSVSSDFFGAYKFATAAKEPVVGAGFDGGPEWMDIKDNPTLFDAYGGGVNFSEVPTTWGSAFKIMGVTKATGLGYIESPSATEAAEAGVASAKAAGIPTIPATQVHFGTTDVGPQVLALKAAGINGIYIPTVPNTAFALIGGLEQAGIKLDGAIIATGYGEDLLESKAAVAAGQGDYFSSGSAPVELKTPGTKAFQAALKKYANYTSIPSFAQYEGYLTGAAFVDGLKLPATGVNPTQASFNAAMRHATFDSAGLSKPINFGVTGTSAAGMGPGNCIYLPQLKGNKFVINPKLNPICGTVIKGLTNKP